jgi:hypothetical protein
MDVHVLGMVLAVVQVAALAELHQGPNAAWSVRQNRGRWPVHSRSEPTWEMQMPVLLALRGGQLGRVPPSATPERRHLNLQLWEASRLGRPELLQAMVKQGAEVNAAFETKDDARRHCLHCVHQPLFPVRPGRPCTICPLTTYPFFVTCAGRRCTLPRKTVILQSSKSLRD